MTSPDLAESWRNCFEEELICPICLHVFSEPIQLPCKHNFCRGCISEAWAKDSTVARCPECNHGYAQKPTLREEPQTLQHRGKVQRSECGEDVHSGFTVYPVPPQPASARREGVPALQRPLLSVARTDAPTAAVLRPGASAGGGGGGEGVDLPPARPVPAVPLRRRADRRVPVLLLRPLPPHPRARGQRRGAAAQRHTANSAPSAGEGGGASAGDRGAALQTGLRQMCGGGPRV
ncbi:hypothetical protein NQD34_014014 [Periophthalmus magnuspinnatus]|nr:hypothetical protein NQD34_014014 [Periophthalmus magnuspinnatus]